ncbi:MAG: 50S ribosomal protein L25/general stress protein Ctc [Gammaproteobacteria bacterium]|jgi:large subunit ribosomal protein L25
MSTNHTFELHAQPRADIGKGASRRLRHAGKLPAIIYGAGSVPESITFLQKDLKKATENEAFFSHILSIHIDGKVHNAVVKDMQRHPYKPIIMHMDLLRINMNEEITMNVPLHFIGEENAPGIKDGGTVSHLANSVEITCLPAKLPEYIAVDVSNLALNHIVHLSDLVLPAGVRLTELEGEEKNDLPVVHITVLKVKEETEEVAPEAEGEVPTIGEEESEEK